MQPISVELKSYTENPAETLYCIWRESREPDFNEKPKDVRRKRIDGVPSSLNSDIVQLVKSIIDSDIPVAENVSFTFSLRGIPVALREQIVRHRIGVKMGDLLGCDMIPELASSTFWAQSMRVLNMGSFASDQAYHTPDLGLSTTGLSTGLDYYHKAMRDAEAHYNSLIALGWKEEDARLVLPLATNHSLTWTLNLKSIIHILSKRGCWILQLGFWGPIISGIANALAEIEPAFKGMVKPPCVDGANFTGCVVKLDNEKRIKGEDPLPPCSLYLNNHEAEAIRASHSVSPSAWLPLTDGSARHRDSVDADVQLQAMMSAYRQLWQRDPMTGVPL